MFDHFYVLLICLAVLFISGYWYQSLINMEKTAFTTGWVMTVIFHKIGDCCPYSDDIYDIGYGKVLLNVPLVDGIDDET